MTSEIPNNAQVALQCAVESYEPLIGSLNSTYISHLKAPAIADVLKRADAYLKWLKEQE